MMQNQKFWQFLFQSHVGQKTRDEINTTCNFVGISFQAWYSTTCQGLKMFNSTSDENVSVSDVHIGLDTSHDLEYIEEDYTNSTYEDLNNYTTKDYCLVRILTLLSDEANVVLWLIQHLFNNETSSIFHGLFQWITIWSDTALQNKIQNLMIYHICVSSFI